MAAPPDREDPTKGSATVHRHAACVAFGDAAILIRGDSGAGKSAFALELIAAGAALIADDVVALRAGSDGVWAGPAVDASRLRPAAVRAPALAGVVEARGVGLLRVAPGAKAAAARLALIAALEPSTASASALAPTPTPRLPNPRYVYLFGRLVPLISVREGASAAARLLARRVATPALDL